MRGPRAEVGYGRYSGCGLERGKDMTGMEIKTCVLGRVGTNCYLVYNKATKEAVIVDPADDGAQIADKCRELGLSPAAILLTHGHFDHIMAAEDVRQEFNIKIYASVIEDAMLSDPGLNLSGGFTGVQVGFHGDELLKDGDRLDLIGFQWLVMETPGHTTGSVCYYVPEEQVVFAGDTLFNGSFGRTDLPTGSSRQIVASIFDKVFALPEDTVVYPGHGDATSIGYEKQNNPIGRYRR